MFAQIARLLRRLAGRPAFEGSANYWENRYRAGGNSGCGSYGELAKFKADYLNDFVRKQGVRTVLEFGCGDGNQLTLASYPDYTGVDVSQAAVEACRKKFEGDSTKRFLLLSQFSSQRADLVLSLDVIYHLVEDPVYHAYMRNLFATADRFVVIYSSDAPEEAPASTNHVRQRKFTRWIEANAPGWVLMEHVPNRFPYQGDWKTESWSEFFVYCPASKKV